MHLVDSSTMVLYQKHEQVHQDLEGPKLLLFKKLDIKGETQWLVFFFSRNWIKNNIVIFNIRFFLHVYIVFMKRFFSSVHTVLEKKKKKVASVVKSLSKLLVRLSKTLVYVHSDFQNPALLTLRFLTRDTDQRSVQTRRLVKSILLA